MMRTMHPQDAVSLQKACEPPSITKYMTLAFAYPYTLQHAETWVNLNLTERLPNYIIVLPDDPQTAIGGIGLKPGSDVQSHTAEIGYWIGEPHWGKGYAAEALVGLTDWVFSKQGEGYGVGEGQKGFSRLWAGVMGGNEASIKVLEKCGYAKEGVLKAHVEKHGVVMDEHVFGLTRADWEQRRRQQ
jgi:RimJ/RimL family protein N-acetyltransferase